MSAALSELGPVGEGRQQVGQAGRDRWRGLDCLTTGERTKRSGENPRRHRTAPHSSDSDGLAPCEGFSACHVSLHCSRGTPRSTYARGGQGTQVTLL